MIDARPEPTAREVRIFGWLCLLFFGLVGAIALWRPGGLVGAAMILGLAWLVSLVFNAQERVRQLSGVLLPGMFALVGGAVLLNWPAVTLDSLGLPEILSHYNVYRDEVPLFSPDVTDFIHGI